MLYSQMGNQMFQYAFAFSTSKIVKTHYLLSLTDSDTQFHLKYFELDPLTHLFFNVGYITKIYRKFTRFFLKENHIDSIFDPEIALVNNKRNNVIYRGYFQSEDYFKLFRSEIKLFFKIRKKYSSQFNSKYKVFFSYNKTIVIHFRRKDYNDIELESLGGKGYVLPLDYYEKALSTIEDIHTYEIFFIGDDVDSVRNDFEHKPNYHFEENSAIVDFQLIQNADIAIIANSTFAWWAAYLSLKPDSRILAPKYWLGFKVKETFPPKIETNKFEWVEF